MHTFPHGATLLPLLVGMSWAASQEVLARRLSDVFAVLIALWLTSSLWFFTTVGVKF